MLNLTAKNIEVEGDTAYYTYRGKGGKNGRRELPRPAYEAIRATLADAGLDPTSMGRDDSLWQAGADGRGVTSATFYNRLRRYQRASGVGGSGVHVLRHSAAKLRRDAGETVEAVSQFLDHSSLAVTSVYLKRLEGVDDVGWGKIAEALGL